MAWCPADVPPPGPGRSPLGTPWPRRLRHGAFMNRSHWSWSRRPGCCAALLVLAACRPVPAAEPAPPGVVSHVKMLSDRVKDVSSLAAWKRSFLRPDMSDRAKALAVWETVVQFRHQDVPPLE